MCLSAQSLYLLLISTFGRLANAEYLSFGESVLNPNERKSAIAKVPKIGERWCSPKTIFTCIIIPANAFALAGGLMTTSESAGAPMDPSKAPTSVGLQATGQFVLLALATALSLRSLSVTNRNRIRNCTASTVSFACMFLVSRAIYGFISCFIRELNYFIPYNYYTHTGAYTTFTTTYYIFGPTMEFCSVILLLSSYFVPNQHEYGLTNNQIVD
ncbi:hypothetical protein TRICI_003396 [Trichomonascus ciferrii]|uniref:Uncharacterized protein n=1 Tax=Trichomonascus ciferrii TaxID=44093 RepID=A0A642VA63_9ASCO|nr:hypothetical protein TRICI_003396 [Trichomonascus ciferrii]